MPNIKVRTTKVSRTTGAAAAAAAAAAVGGGAAAGCGSRSGGGGGMRWSLSLSSPLGSGGGVCGGGVCMVRYCEPYIKRPSNREQPQALP